MFVHVCFAGGFSRNLCCSHNFVGNGLNDTSDSSQSFGINTRNVKNAVTSSHLTSSDINFSRDLEFEDGFHRDLDLNTTVTFSFLLLKQEEKV